MTVITFDGTVVLHIAEDGPLLSSEQDALDLLGETYGTDIALIAVPKGRLAPSFFDLSTRQAGLFLQKLQNYQMRLAIVGDIATPLAASAALRDFVRETNRIGHHFFVPDEAALASALKRKD